MFSLWDSLLRRAASGTAPVQRSRPAFRFAIEDQEELNRFEQVRSNIEMKIKMAGFRNEAVKHAFEAQLEITELLIKTKMETRYILREGTSVAKELSNPSAVVGPQVAALVRRDRKRLALASSLAFVKLCCYALVCWTVIDVVRTVTRRERPEVEGLLTAVGQNPRGWTTFVSANPLNNLLASCAQHPVKANAQNPAYCWVPVFMDRVEPDPPSTPPWAQDPPGRASR